MAAAPTIPIPATAWFAAPGVAVDEAPPALASLAWEAVVEAPVISDPRELVTEAMALVRDPMAEL